MNSTDELASSLRCTELLADSPSTSSRLMHTYQHQRRENHYFPGQRRPTNRTVLQPVNTKRTIIPQSRKRTSLDSRLNSAQHPAVRTLGDRNLFLDHRVLGNLRKSEASMGVNSHYFTSIQENIESYHREQAVEWIADVAKEEGCDVDVLPTAVSLMDRFLSNQNIYSHDIQVLAGVCLFMASKMKAPQPLTANRLSYYSADSVKVEDFLAWELLVLSQVEWDLSSPTAFDFFDQVVHRLPAASFYQQSFTTIIHKIQKDSKLGMMIPSLQCGMALLFAVGNNQYIHNQLDSLLPFTLDVDTKYLRELLPIVERVLTPEVAAEMNVSPAAPPSSCRTPSPCLLVPCSSDGTPLNDSGFCSGVSSPESAGKKEMDCSPPKMARYMC